VRQVGQGGVARQCQDKRFTAYRRQRHTPLDGAS
jgi:hypothetical protein